MKVRKRDEHSFGWRLMRVREDRQMSQKEVAERLKQYDSDDIPRTAPAISQLELGDTKRVHIDLLLALSEILDVDVRYLLTGGEAGAVQFYSAEAEDIARIVDAMPASMRRMMLDAAKATQQLATELLASQRRIAQLLEENIMLLENGDRSVAHDYIESIGYHRTAER